MISDSSTSDFGSNFSNDSMDSVTAGFIDENVCGESGSCIVYGLRKDGQRVAVKRLKKEYKTDPQYVCAIRKEFQIGQQLRHPAIPVYHSVRIDTDEVYVVMDFVDGDTLEDFIKTSEGKEYFRSKENVQRFLKELLNAVGYLHRSGVIHSDIKPANIMIRKIDSNVILLDLDKCYSDTLDTTHGGSSNFSDALSSDQKPTVSKDFKAIGRILVEIATHVPDFPSQQFKRFRKECSDEKTTYLKLASSLDEKPYVKIGYIACASLALFILLMIFIWKQDRKDDSTDTNPIVSETAPIPSVGTPKDSTIQIATPAISVSSSIKTEESKSTKFDIDIDNQMADFTSKVESATQELSSGISRNRLNEILYDLVMAHSSSYKRIVEDAKSRYPHTDVEIDVARAYERSRTKKTFDRFNKAVSDTLRIWDTPKVSDDNL